MMVHIRAEEPSGKSDRVITGGAAGAGKYARRLCARERFCLYQSVPQEHTRLRGSSARVFFGGFLNIPLVN